EKLEEKAELARLEQIEETKTTTSERKKNFKEEKQLQSQKRKKERRITELESQIEEKELEIAVLEEEMTKPEVFQNHKKALELTETTQNLKAEIDHLFEEWEELQD